MFNCFPQLNNSACLPPPHVTGCSSFSLPLHPGFIFHVKALSSPGCCIFPSTPSYVLFPICNFSPTCMGSPHARAQQGCGVAQSSVGFGTSLGHLGATMRGSLQKSPKSLQLTLPGGCDETPDCPEKYPRGAENWENSPHSCSSLNQHCLPALS